MSSTILDELDVPTVNHEQRARSASPKKRGFAAMDPEKQRQIASLGGRAAHEKGTAHQYTPEEAREAGRKGGIAVSQDREHMAAIGKVGGASSGRALP